MFERKDGIWTIESHDKLEFDKEVKQFLESGCELLGGYNIINNNDGDVIYTQMIVLEKNFKFHFSDDRYDDGGMYAGEWIENKRDGQGTMKFKKGHPQYVKYEGGWRNDKMFGQGTMNYVNGDIYIGEWFNSKRHGKGTTTYTDGGVDSGIWKRDKLRERK